MKSCLSSLSLVFIVILISNSYAWNQKIDASCTIREVLLSDATGEIALTVSYIASSNYLDADIVDVAIGNTRGETLYFHTERTYYNCEVSYEDFVVDGALGTMVLVTVCNGGNFSPYESWAIFLNHSDMTVSDSSTPTECHNMGGPGPHYPSQLDVDGDGIYDHLSYPDYLFYLPNECQALKRQLWTEFCRIPSSATRGSIALEDNTLAVLTDPASQAFRDIWIENMSAWLEESIEVSQSNPSILEVRGKVWAFKEALSNQNYDLVSDLYSDL